MKKVQKIGNTILLRIKNNFEKVNITKSIDEFNLNVDLYIKVLEAKGLNDIK